jgi:hypothetical protein
MNKTMVQTIIKEGIQAAGIDINHALRRVLVFISVEHAVMYIRVSMQNAEMKGVQQ